MLKNTLRLLACLVLTLPLASCQKKTNPALLGEWEGKANNKTVSLTFEKDGRMGWGGDIAALGTLFTSFTMLTDYGARPAFDTITYKCVSGTQMEVEGDLSAMMEKLSAGGRDGGMAKPNPEIIKKLHPKETLTYAVAGTELTLTNAAGKSLKLRKTE